MEVQHEEENLITSLPFLQIKILQYLSLSDIKNCRLVSATWNSDSSPLLLKKSCLNFEVMNDPAMLRDGTLQETTFTSTILNMLRSPTVPWNNPWSRGEDKGKQLFHKERNKSSLIGNKLPQNIQHLKIAIYKYCPEFNRFPVNICKTFSKTLVELDYSLPITLQMHVEIEMFKYIIPRLRHLKKLRITLLIVHREEELCPFFPTEETCVKDLTLRFGDRPFQGCREFGCENEHYRKVCKIVQNFHIIFPELEALTLRHGSNALSDRFLEAIMENEIRPNLKNLTQLKVENGLRFNFVPFLRLEFPMALTSLSVNFFRSWIVPNYEQVAKTYEQLIWWHVPTLTHLQFRTHSLYESSSVPFDLVLPSMKKLKSLEHFHVDTGANIPQVVNYNVKFCVMGDKSASCGYLDYSTQFPVLENLTVILKYNDRDHRGHYLRSEAALNVFLPQDQMPPISCPTLQNLNIRGLIIMDDTAEHLKNIEEAFPNVHNRMLNAVRRSKLKLKR